MCSGGGAKSQGGKTFARSLIRGDAFAGGWPPCAGSSGTGCDWGRAWIYLGLTEGSSTLGLQDDVLLELVLDPELLGEIERLRQAAGC